MSRHFCSKCGHAEHIFGAGGGDKITKFHSSKFPSIVVQNT
jgi:ATP-binding protein involved in chromosome partitioning